MDVSIRPIEEKDFSAIGKLMADYKISTAINRHLWKIWPNTERQNTQTFDTVQRNFKIEGSQLMKAVDNSNGEVVGFIALNRRTPAPGKPESQPATNTGPIETPEQFKPEVFTSVMKAIGEIAKETDHLDHIEITALNVRPDHERKGVGSKLVGVALEKARAAKIPVVMRSEPASHGLFRRLGFKETKMVDLDLTAFAEPYSGYGNFRLIGFVWYP